MTSVSVAPLTAPPDATIDLPGSKSITNRALLAAGVAHGTSRLSRYLVADDTEAMAACLRTLGADIRVDGDNAEVVGTGARIAPGPLRLDARQSGTTARFMAALVAAGTGVYELDAADQMRARPMDPLVDALRELEVEVDEVDAARPGRLPLRVRGGVTDAATRIRGDVSSQFISGLMLAAPLYPQGLRVVLTTPLVSRPYVAMTEAVMREFGGSVEVADERVTVAPGGYRATGYRIEPDASAASYFFAAAAVCRGRVRVPGLGERSLQGDAAFADLLERMGSKVTRTASYTEVVGGERLTGIDADLRDLSDTAPTLAVVAALADTPTRVTGIGFIRRKETDRIAAVVNELRRCGVDAEEEPDGFVVRPGGARGATVETYDDHRMAMSFAVLGLAVPGVDISGPECVAKTFPGFFSALDRLRRQAT